MKEEEEEIRPEVEKEKLCISCFHPLCVKNTTLVCLNFCCKTADLQQKVMPRQETAGRPRVLPRPYCTLGTFTYIIPT